MRELGNQVKERQMDNISSEHQSAYTKNEPLGKAGCHVGWWRTSAALCIQSYFSFWWLFQTWILSYKRQQWATAWEGCRRMRKNPHTCSALIVFLAILSQCSSHVIDCCLLTWALFKSGWSEKTVSSSQERILCYNLNF